MNRLFNDALVSIEFGEVQSFGNMKVLPLFSNQKSELDYLVLSEALDLNLLEIVEVDDDGSVPNLKVINNGKKPIFLLDGEELVGAKQNRVLNTSILLKELSETIVPVSCTEQGRWSYESEVFSDSCVVMSPSVRHHKVQSVSKSLRSNRGAQSDQSKVWQEIDKFSIKADVDSDTGAMRDVFESKQKLLEEYNKAFQFIDKQTGFLVIINNKVVGFDIFSCSNAFQILYPKLLKSYSMDAILSEKGKPNISSKKLIEAFFKLITLSTQSEHKTVGYGKDYRFTGKGTVGSALVHKKTIVHMAFFKNESTENDESISSSGMRRKYRE